MASNDRDKNSITFEITEHIGVISTSPTGWTKECNLVSWNGGSEKVDIRDWDPEHKHMSKGITLHRDEAKTLRGLLDSMELSKAQKKSIPQQLAEGAEQAAKDNAARPSPAKGKEKNTER